jgi:hypothetical protein
MAKGVKTGGRKAGSPNKTTALLKEAILQAAIQAGGKDGLIGYLRNRATDDNPAPFMSLLGKVVPLQVEGNPDKPIKHDFSVRFVSASETE